MNSVGQRLPAWSDRRPSPVQHRTSPPWYPRLSPLYDYTGASRHVRDDEGPPIECCTVTTAPTLLQTIHRLRHDPSASSRTLRRPPHRSSSPASRGDGSAVKLGSRIRRSKRSWHRRPPGAFTGIGECGIGQSRYVIAADLKRGSRPVPALMPNHSCSAIRLHRVVPVADCIASPAVTELVDTRTNVGSK